MQLALSFTTLLATILLVLSAAENGAEAAPMKRSRSVTLPLTRLHQNRADIHPQILLQQHINRSEKRYARMKGRAGPSKRDMEERIARRMFVPSGNLTNVNVRRYNRQGSREKAKTQPVAQGKLTDVLAGGDLGDALSGGGKLGDALSGLKGIIDGLKGLKGDNDKQAAGDDNDAGNDDDDDSGAAAGSDNSTDTGVASGSGNSTDTGAAADSGKGNKSGADSGKNKADKHAGSGKADKNGDDAGADDAGENGSAGNSGNATDTGAATGASNSTASAGAGDDGAAAAANNLTPADPPTADNSLGLDIEANDVGYIATIQMGTPPRDFKILMDSGSADLWVGAEGCQSEAGGDCGNHQFLGPKSSSSFKDLAQQFQVTYGTGAVAGDIIQDNIEIAGLKLDAHTFGVASAETEDFSDDSVPFDGLMGLAQSTLSQQGVPTPVEALAKAGLIDDAITSYKISRLADNKNDGEITFGALDESKFDPATLVTFDNVADNGFWEGAMDAVTVDGKDLGLQNRSAILDTGTTLIIAPQADAEAVHAAIDGAQSDGQGGFTIPCDTKASVALTFAGQEFAIDTRDLIFAQADAAGKDCISGISAGEIDGDTTWLVGDVFLKNAYFSTDVGKNQMSLAKLV